MELYSSLVSAVSILDMERGLVAWFVSEEEGEYDGSESERERWYREREKQREREGVSKKGVWDNGGEL